MYMCISFTLILHIVCTCVMIIILIYIPELLNGVRKNKNNNKKKSRGLAVVSFSTTSLCWDVHFFFYLPTLPPSLSLPPSLPPTLPFSPSSPLAFLPKFSQKNIPQE